MSGAQLTLLLLVVLISAMAGLIAGGLLGLFLRGLRFLFRLIVGGRP